MMDDPAFYEDPFGGDGFLVKAEPSRRVWVRWNDDAGRFEQCITYRVDPVLDANAENQADNLNKRWGDGDVVARIPLTLYYEKFAPLRKEGDDAAISKILNDSDFSKLRTRGGTV